MSLIILTDGLRLGLIYAIMALGIFISFRILNIPDLTVDGSFTLGMAVFAVFAMDGRPFLGLLLAPLAGLAAGCVTGLLLTKLKVQPILAGILTMTGLYSINLLVMKESPNISLFNSGTVFSLAETILPGFFEAIRQFFVSGLGFGGADPFIIIVPAHAVGYVFAGNGRQRSYGSGFLHQR